MKMGGKAFFACLLLAQAHFATSYVSTLPNNKLLLGKFLRSNLPICSRSYRKLNLIASLEEDLGKPFGDFGRKIGKSIDWFFDTSHVTGGTVLTSFVKIQEFEFFP